MNTRNVYVLIVAAALVTSASVPMFAASKDDTPIAYSVNTVTSTSNGDIKVTRGMDRGDVSFAMKYKSHDELSHDVWVFTGYVANVDKVNDQGCRTLIVTFANDKVVDLQLVNRLAADEIAANLRLGSSARNIASK